MVLISIKLCECGVVENIYTFVTIFTINLSGISLCFIVSVKISLYNYNYVT